MKNFRILNYEIAEEELTEELYYQRESFLRELKIKDNIIDSLRSELANKISESPLGLYKDTIVECLKLKIKVLEHEIKLRADMSDFYLKAFETASKSVAYYKALASNKNS